MTVALVFCERHRRSGSDEVLVEQSAGVLHVRRGRVRWHNDGEFQWEGPTDTRPRLPWHWLSPRLYARMIAARYRTPALDCELL